jgi:transposase
MTAALLEDEVIAMQFVEGASDSVVFENFLYHTLHHLRSHEDYKHRPIVALVDNARTHSHAGLATLARKMKTTIVYNAQYSPWLNPVEQLHQALKHRLASSSVVK